VSDSVSVAIGNGCSIFGRIIPLIIAQKFGTINIFALFALTSGVMLFLWTTAKTVQGFLIYEAFYGVASGKLNQPCSWCWLKTLRCIRSISQSRRSVLCA
jgi:hypothetical protein